MAFFALGIAGLFGWVLVHANHPGRWPPGYPLTLRLPVLIYEIPGVDWLVTWEARHDARAAHNADRHVLFGMYQSGTEFGLKDRCEVKSYGRRRFRLKDPPAWASGALKGTVQLSCGPQVGSVHEFTVVEVGCIAYGADHFYSRIYNNAALDLTLQQ
ncbi:MAG: hypothetical protein GY722_06235 [bacterium]|nr:hypothetical protein [bacterium]